MNSDQEELSKLNDPSPLVSVVLSNYNSALSLFSTLKSVLDQSYSNLEIICLDDGSTDDSWQKILEFSKLDPRIKPVRLFQNIGLTAALIKGVEISKGQYLSRIDVGDFWIDSKISRQVAFMDKYLDVVVLGTQVFYSNGNSMFQSNFSTSDLDIRRKFLTGEGIFEHSSIMFRNNGINYDKRFKYSQDLDLYMRLSNFGRLACLESAETISAYNPNGITNTKKYYQRQFQKISKRGYRDFYSKNIKKLPDECFILYENRIGKFLCHLSMGYFQKYVICSLNKSGWFLRVFYLAISCMIYPPFMVDYLSKILGRIKFLFSDKEIDSNKMVKT